MKANIGCTDRVLRVVFGVALITLTLTGIIGAWGWLGVIPLVTGLIRFCPVYTLLGLKTCKPDGSCSVK